MMTSFANDVDKKPIISMEKFEFLRQEAEQLIENLQQGGASVGEAEFVEYEESWASAQGVGRFGRMTLKDGVRLYHAAPAIMDRTQSMNYPERDFIGYAHQWAMGTSIHPPVRDLVKDPELPTAKFRKSRTLAFYERKLFELLGGTHKITLVNPSFSTMTELKTTCGGYVTLTSGVSEQWALDIRDYVAKSDRKLKMLPKKTIKGIAYLGTNQPVWMPPSENYWVRLILSPFNDVSDLFQSYSVDVQDTMIVSKYRKDKQYTVTSILPRDPLGMLYNPKTVDSWLGQKHELAFIETTYPFELQQVDEVRVQHAPWFVKGEGIWVELEGDLWKVDDKEIIDVVGQGTYLSRRVHFVPPEGYKWTPLCTFGSYWVTYSSLLPHHQLGMSLHQVVRDKISQKVLTFSNEQIITKIEEVSPPKGAYYTVGPVVSGLVTELPSDDRVRMVMGDRPRGRNVVIFDHVYKDNNGRYYDPTSIVSSAVLYKLGGPLGVKGIMPSGSTDPATALVTSLRSYILVSQFSPGQYFAFSSMRKMAQSLHMTSLFMTRWMTLESLEKGVQNPESGGMVRSNEEYQNLDQLIQTQRVTWPTDSPKTVGQIAQETDMSTEFVFRFYQKHARVYVWKTGTKFRTSFVIESALRVQFSGTILDGFYDGLMWADAMQVLGGLLPSQQICLLFRDRRLSHFIAFLEQNLYQVKIEECLSHVILHVRKGVWS